jgi:hypothetical protein
MTDQRAALTAVVGITSGAKAVWSPPKLSNQVRDRFGFSVGVVSAGSSDHPDNQCSSPGGLSLGAEVRTRGPWLLAADADLLASSGSVCTLVLKTREYQGQTVSVHVSPALAGTRLSLHAGRALTTSGGTVLEPSVGWGWIRQGNGGGFSREPVWLMWYGGSIRLKRVDFGLGFRAEYGIRELPITYDLDRELVARFYERTPMLRVLIEF